MRKQTRRIFRKYYFAEMPPDDIEEKLKEENKFYQAFRALGHIRGMPPSSKGVFVGPFHGEIYHISTTHYTPLKPGEETMFIEATNEKGFGYKPVLQVPVHEEARGYPRVQDLTIRKIPDIAHKLIPEVLEVANRQVKSGETGWLIGNDIRHLPEKLEAIEDYVNRIYPHADQLISRMAPSRIWLPAGWRTDLWNYSMPVEVEMKGWTRQGGEPFQVNFETKREQNRIKGNFPGILPGHSSSPIVNKEGKLLTLVRGASTVDRQGIGTVGPKGLRSLLGVVSQYSIDTEKVRRKAKKLKDKDNWRSLNIKRKMDKVPAESYPITYEEEKELLDEKTSTAELANLVEQVAVKRMLMEYRGYPERTFAVTGAGEKFSEMAKDILRERLEKPKEKSILLSKGPPTIGGFLEYFKGGEDKTPASEKISYNSSKQIPFFNID